jgi:hypothetical protein
MFNAVRCAIMNNGQHMQSMNAMTWFPFKIASTERNIDSLSTSNEERTR